jgi:YidC/Oxa1 family membrane protein insertase
VNEQRNFLLAFAIIFVTLMGYEYFIPKQAPLIVKNEPAQVAELPKISSLKLNMSEPLSRDLALKNSNRLQIDTPSFTGSINLKGGRLDDLTLKGYKQDVDSDKMVDLLDPESSRTPFFLDFSWSSPSMKGITLPSDQSQWTANRSTLSPNSPVVLTWKSPEDVVFERHIQVDNEQLFTIKEVVHNHSKTMFSAIFSGSIVRIGTIKESDSKLSHEGVVGYLDRKLKEVTYADITSSPIIQASNGGWLGMTDKYWMLTLAVSGDQPINANIHSLPGSRPLYNAALSTKWMECASGETLELPEIHVLAGAKIVDMLDRYEEKYNISNLDLMVDFGWLYFLTKPLYHLLTFLKNWIGNFALAILALTVLVKMLMFPLIRKSSTAMAGMKKLQPEIERLKKMYPDDAMKRNQEVMGLYKKYKINPAGGCLPILIQIPVFFALYKVLVITIEMRHAPFWGWIKDMSVQDPTTIFNMFGLVPWDPPSFLMIGIWPMIMGLTMWLQQKLAPQTAVVDPNMAKMMNLLPFFLTFVMAAFPAGLLIYWAWSNILSIVQQLVINKIAKNA